LQALTIGQQAHEDDKPTEQYESMDAFTFTLINVFTM